jgi:hypothetical protein
MPALLFARHAMCCKLVESRENDRVPQQTRGVPGRAGKPESEGRGADAASFFGKAAGRS